MTLLRVNQLNYNINNKKILKEISVGIKPGENIALLGANGAGKSTLLRILLGLIRPVTGDIYLQEKPLYRLSRRDIARKISYVPQSHTPNFPFTVSHIIAQGRLPSTGLLIPAREEDMKHVRRVLAELGIEDLINRIYTELSGGERQLVLIARALVQQTHLIILDEPATGLDYGHQTNLLKLLEKLTQQGISILSSTHSPEHALISANRVWVLHEGRLMADGTPEAIIDSHLMQKIYRVQVKQIDACGQRFFIPLRGVTNESL